jgi:hypothetical protein
MMETLIFWHFSPNVIFTSKEIILAITFHGPHHDLVDHYGYKAKDRVTRTPLKTGGELRCSGRVSSSCSTHHVNLVINPVISHE